jgi:hypothetical protein
MEQQQKVPLEKELLYYESNKSEWLKSHSGEFVLISEQRAAGFFPSYERAFEAGLSTFGISIDFLIRQIVEHEPVFVIY